MKSTHNTARAYGKSVLSTLAIITGTAVMIAACSSVKPPAADAAAADEQLQAVRGKPNKLREHFNFTGVPIRVFFRKK